MSPVVSTSPAVSMRVAPVKFTSPSELMSPFTRMLKIPVVAFKSTVPPSAVVIAASTVIALLLTSRPSTVA